MKKIFELLKKTINICYQKKRGYIIALFILALLKAIIPFITLLSFQTLINMVQFHDIVNIRFKVTIYFLSLIAMKAIAETYKYMLGKLKTSMDFAINSYIIENIIDLPLESFENSDTYDKLHGSLRDTQAPYQTITFLFDLIENVVNLVLSLLLLLTWRKELVIVFIVLPIISLYFTIKIGQYEFHEMQKRIPFIRKTAYIRELLTGATSSKENRVLGIEKELFYKFKKYFTGFMVKDREILKFQFINGLIFQVLETVVGIVIIIFIFISLLSGEILIGTANTFITCIWNTIRNYDAIMINTAKLFNKRQYLNNLYEFINSNRKDICQEGNLQQIKEINEIEFKNVSFKYREDLSDAITNVSFKISKSEKVILVGKNGSGKSTVIKLILGIYSNYKGDILINDIPLKNIDKESLYNCLGVVFQDFTKYEFSLKDNLMLGNKNMTIDIETESKFFEENGMLRFIRQLPLCLDTQLGNKFEEGVQLSGGEWQQVVFARTMANKVTLYILDEPSSGLDVFSEKSMYDILERDFTECINIIVTHRLYIINPYIYRAIVFKDGLVIEDDSVENLLNRDSYYHKMYNKLSCEEEETIGS